MTHVKIQEDLLPIIGRVEQVLNREVGFVEAYDFAKANTSYEARVQTITKIASICYASPKALGSISLFNRLQAESGGLPSSSYEFVPILIPKHRIDATKLQQCHKFGEHIGDFLLTNLRALLEDVGEESSLEYFNTESAEIQIIRDNFKVFLFNVDLSTRSQMVRHRVSWQELSRRYVSGKKREFEFYTSERMKNVTSSNMLSTDGNEENDLEALVTTSHIIDICLNHYNKAIELGVKPEEARRILPQAMMTQIWGAFQPKQLRGFFNLRLDAHSQLEIRCVAESMKGIIDG